MLELLRTYSRAEDWHTAAEVIWGAVLDGRDMDQDEVIGLLYYRLPPDDASTGDDFANLGWSIAARLKAKGYLSNYDPLQDAGVRGVLDRLRSTNPIDGA
jgi:hypothetical protein